MPQKASICFDFKDSERVGDIAANLNWFDSDFVSFGSFDSLNSFLKIAEKESVDPDEIRSLLNETDITVVFIGKHTFENAFCLQMIDESFRRENAFLAVYLNNAEDVVKTGREILGKNPLDLFYFEHKDGATTLNHGAVVLPGKLKRRISSKDMKAKIDFVKVYDYVKDNGAENLEKWIEEERQRKVDFWAECGKISKEEWTSALKVTNKGGIASFFLYYDWANYSKDLS
ncbi:hypothetical protein MmiEs2_05050 [Methanimicrococcus stummii]|uniref:Uncharacterized protein n=1 Tax=Methanimicrococcus stummii TaxID=3028294 RepID=A0AA96V9V4_9EURY|nr:TIR domain-containing protein [Methanimicrococcus sp. Es2]WNY28320.1 hypothetical protein MmiEs2_05050 [Methanimicrococcus sp. Es2]